MISFMISVVPPKHHRTSCGRWELCKGLGYGDPARAAREVLIVPLARRDAIHVVPPRRALL
jgi:hypothetical protein